MNSANLPRIRNPYLNDGVTKRVLHRHFSLSLTWIRLFQRLVVTRLFGIDRCKVSNAILGAVVVLREFIAVDQEHLASVDIQELTNG